jgi:hypothetical protein
MIDDMTTLSNIIKGEKWYDFYFAIYDGNSVLIKGTLDITYGHNLEIRLKGVHYIDAPTEWKTDTSAVEVVRLFKNEDFDEGTRKRYFDQGGQWALGFNAECFDSAQWFYFVIDSFTFTHKGKWDEWNWYDSPNPPPIAGAC